MTKEQTNTIFESAFQYSGIGMALVSPEGKWLRVNGSLLSILGYSESELLAKTFQDITHPDDLELDLKQVTQMLQKEIETYQMKKRYLHKDGHIVWVNLTVSLVWKGDNTPDFFISQIEDITKEKETEEILREKIAQMEQMNNLMTGRENKMIELKQEVDALLQELGRKSKYYTT